jgi:hypothetical protein
MELTSYVAADAALANSIAATTNAQRHATRMLLMP